MIRISTENLPRLVVNNITYIFYYSLIWYILWFAILFMSAYSGIIGQMTDYQLFISPIIFAVPFGFVTNLFIIPIEKKLIKRNIFVAGFINILKNSKGMVFRDIDDNYAYALYQNNKVSIFDKEVVSYVEALISLGVVKLKNHKKLKDKNVRFNYDYFVKHLDDCEFELCDTKVNIDELINRLDNYVL